MHPAFVFLCILFQVQYIWFQVQYILFQVQRQSSVVVMGLFHKKDAGVVEAVA